MRRDFDDSRRAPRLDVRVPCQLVGAGVWHEPVRFPIRNLSPYGMWIETDYPLDPGDQVLASFRPPGTGRAVVVRAVVVRSRLRDGDSGMALAFVEMLPAAFDRLTRSLSSRTERGEARVDRRPRRRSRPRGRIRALPGPGAA
jgi:hypothetical protein